MDLNSDQLMEISMIHFPVHILDNGLEGSDHLC